MFSSNEQIKALVAAGKIGIDPFDPKHLKAASYVLHLGSRVRRWRALDSPINVWSERAYEQGLEPVEESSSIVVESGQFILGASIERLALPQSHIGVIAGLSHLARVGITVDLGASWVGPGYGSRKMTALTLEIVNSNPSSITLKAGMPVCHLRIAEVDRTGLREPAGRPSIYEGLDPLNDPLLFEEFGELGLLAKSEQENAQIEWPPQCCVPAFVHRSMQLIGVEPPPPEQVAFAMNVKVDSLDPNPWNFPVASRREDRGVVFQRAVQAITSLLSNISPHIQFRHIPFNTIALELYEEVLSEALARALPVGVGIDPLVLSIPGAEAENRHVLRIESVQERQVHLVDDSGGRATPLVVSWKVLERAVTAIGDGFWIFGRGSDLEFSNTLPYRPVDK
jgi:dCTP deaminase